MVSYFGWTLVLGPRPPAHHDAPSFTFSSPLCWTLGRFRSSAHRRPPSPFKKLEGFSRGRSVPGNSAPSAPKNVRRGQARARGRRAGGASGLLRGPQAGGRGVSAAGRDRGCGCAQDPAQERRHEGGDAAGGLRNCSHRIREAQYGEGHRGVHKEGVRQEPRPNLALHRRPQLRSCQAYVNNLRPAKFCLLCHVTCIHILL